MIPGVYAMIMMADHQTFFAVYLTPTHHLILVVHLLTSSDG
jgi:hypothetical protein